MIYHNILNMVIVTDGYFDLKENKIAKEIIFFKKMSAC